MSTQKSKRNRRRAIDESFRIYMSAAFQRERGFFCKLELLGVCRVRSAEWLRDRDAGNPLPVICYTDLCPEEDRTAFAEFTTRERILFNAECIRVFDEDTEFLSELMLCTGLQKLKTFYARMVPVLRFVDEQTALHTPDHLKEELCVVDHKNCLVASIDSETLSEDSTNHQGVSEPINDESRFPAQIECDGRDEPGSDDNSTFARLDLVLDLVSPYLTCEDKIILDMALEGSAVRQQHHIELCRTERKFRDVGQSIFDYHLSSNKRIYDGWIFTKSVARNKHFRKSIPPILGWGDPCCLCESDIRRYYRHHSYVRLRGISRRLDPSPRKRKNTFLGHCLTHVLTS